MITREDIGKCGFGSSDLLNLAHDLINERDAYREVAILNIDPRTRYEDCSSVDGVFDFIDNEAQRILGEK